MKPFNHPLLKWVITVFVCLGVVYLITGCTPMVGGRCIDTAIIKAQELERDGYKSLIAYGELSNGVYHVHAMWYNGKDYQLAFPDPGFKEIKEYYGWRQVQKMWREVQKKWR